MASAARMLCTRTASQAAAALLRAGASGSGPSTTLAPLAVRLPVRSGDCVRGMAGQEYLSNRFPKGSFASSQTLGRTSGMRPPVVTSDQVFDPFAGVPPGMTASRLLTPEGWRYLWTRMKGTAQNLYALAQAHKYCKPFKVPAFKEEALRLYEELNASVAAGDRRALIGATAPNVNAMFKRQIKAREDAGVARVEWSLAERPTVKDVTMLQARAAMGDPKDKDTGFVQITLKFKTQQRFKAFGRDGRLIAGGPDPVEVEDLWVLERPFKQQETNRWRLVGKLYPVPGTHAYSCSAPVAASLSAKEVADRLQADGKRRQRA